ncbi:MAG: BMC domain-containing protein [Firmicutes bacterium]|nr:BMC domain-containing protein [Bacillota bacterium]
MEQQALGLIETVGLAAAVEGADAAVKAANVRLIGYELARGGGMVTVKITGDVAAAQAAVAAGAAAASRVGKVVSKLVIPRPHSDLTKLIRSPETVGEAKSTRKAEKAVAQQEATPVEEAVQPVEEAAPAEAATGPEPESSAAEVCNLCGDPACPRRKGEPHSRCIHHAE